MDDSVPSDLPAAATLARITLTLSLGGYLQTAVWPPSESARWGAERLLWPQSFSLMQMLLGGLGVISSQSQWDNTESRGGTGDICSKQRTRSCWVMQKRRWGSAPDQGVELSFLAVSLSLEGIANCP